MVLFKLEGRCTPRGPCGLQREVGDSVYPSAGTEETLASPSRVWPSPSPIRAPRQERQSECLEAGKKGAAGDRSGKRPGLGQLGACRIDILDPDNSL